MEGFQPIELNILEYVEERGAHIAPHFDDFWIWGERIVGINMLQDTTLTYYKTITHFLGAEEEEDVSIEIEIPVPRFAMYIISRQARFDWLHGIKPEHIKGRRIVCTVREIGEEYCA